MIGSHGTNLQKPVLLFLLSKRKLIVLECCFSNCGHHVHVVHRAAVCKCEILNARPAFSLKFKAALSHLQGAVRGRNARSDYDDAHARRKRLDI
jgi:hypothetical protein